MAIDGRKHPSWAERRKPGGGITRRWSEAEAQTSRRMSAEGKGDLLVAKVLGRTQAAVKNKRRKLGIAPVRRQMSAWNALRISKLLGVDCSKSVARWMDAGLLSFHYGMYVGLNRVRVATPRNVMLFLRNSTHWHLWDVERVTDPKLKMWAAQLRRGPTGQFLTTGPVARRFNVQTKTVTQWIAKGWLPARRGRGNWRIHEKDLEGFVIPIERERVNAHPRRWTPAELRKLAECVKVATSWAEVSSSMPRRTRQACKTRWLIIGGEATGFKAKRAALRAALKEMEL